MRELWREPGSGLGGAGGSGWSRVESSEEELFSG